MHSLEAEAVTANRSIDLVRIVVIKGYSEERLYRECHERKQKTLNEGLSRITIV